MKFRSHLHSIAIAIAILCVLIAYGGSYYQLSRRGLEEAQRYDIDGFFYVPIKELRISDGTNKHRWRVVFFAPANYLDRHLFRGEGPAGDMLWNLSG